MSAAALPAPNETGLRGWDAALSLDYARRGERTIIAERRHHGPLTVQRPFYPEPGGVCHTYLLHPPAGIVGGDTLTVDLSLGANAHALVTTPGANRWYTSNGHTARLTQTAIVGDGAILESLPQETLVYAGARARAATRIDLRGSGRYFGWEMLCLGRPAANERFDRGTIDFRYELRRDERVLLRERLHGDPLPPGLRGYAAYLTLAATAADGAALTLARDVCAGSTAGIAAATLIGDVLVCRALAPDCAPLARLAGDLWAALRPPLLDRDAHAPRIWRT